MVLRWAWVRSPSIIGERYNSLQVEWISGLFSMLRQMRRGCCCWFSWRDISSWKRMGCTDRTPKRGSWSWVSSWSDCLNGLHPNHQKQCTLLDQPNLLNSEDERGMSCRGWHGTSMGWRSDPHHSLCCVTYSNPWRDFVHWMKLSPKSCSLLRTPVLEAPRNVCMSGPSRAFSWIMILCKKWPCFEFKPVLYCRQSF